MTHRLLRGLAPFALAPLLACTENAIIEQPIELIAMVTGDFDNMGLPLDRLLVNYQSYEGFICCAAWDPELDPEGMSLESEALFTYRAGTNEYELFNYDAAFVNSGTRGFGAFVYNGVDPDDHLVTDAVVVSGVREFVEDRAGLLVVSDWSYDLLEAVWPDAIDFHGDDAALDAAQAGVLGQVSAAVVDERLVNALGSADVGITFNYSDFSLVEAVSPEVEVHLRADVEYRVSGSEGFGSLTDVPVLLSFPAGRGTVIFSAFHWEAQNPAVAESLMDALVPDLRPGVDQEAATGGVTTPTTEQP